MFGVNAPERLPIWKEQRVSHAEDMKYVKGVSYTGTIHIVVNSSESFQGVLHHIVYAGFIRDVKFDRYSRIRAMRRELVALLGSGQGALIVHVCKGHAFCSGFGKRKGCFFTNAAGSLEVKSVEL